MNAYSPFEAGYMESVSTDLFMNYGGENSTNLLNGAYTASCVFLVYILPAL